MRSRSRVELLAPPLLATVPALSGAVGNVGEYTVGQFALTLAVLVALGVLVHLVAKWVLRGRTTAQVALVAATAVAWICCSPLVADRVGVVRPLVGIVLLAGAAAAAIWTVLRLRGDWEPLSRGVGIFAAALFALGLLRLSTAYARVATLIDRSPTARALQSRLPAARLQARPDIYLIILDNVANARVQREVFGRSNRAFEDSLRALGFTIPRDSRSNYSFTSHSLASLLNLGHVEGLRRDLGPESADWMVLYRLSQQNRTARWLHDAGYTVYFEPSVTFAGTALLSVPHVAYGPPLGRAIRAALARNAILELAAGKTIPGRLLQHLGVSAYSSAARLEALRTVADVARRPSPKFVIAHSLVSHEPFDVDGECRPARAEQSPATEGLAYANSLRCTERLVLAAVTRILATSSSPPVIILQADHGSASMHPVGSAITATITPAQARERFGAFGAYYLPGVDQAPWQDTVTPVNVLRTVLRQYFGVPLDPLPDSSYYVVFNHPYRLVNVTQFLAVPQDSIVSSRVASH